MPHSMRAASILFSSALAVLHLQGQATSSGSKPPADVLIFTDGEKLIGHLESASGSSVTFKSDMAGEVTVDWKKIQELRSSQKFAAIPKGLKLKNSENTGNVPQGTVVMTDQNLEVSATPQSAPQSIPVSNIGTLVDEAAFQKAFHHSDFLRDWKGGATAGISLTEATQKDQTFSGSINLVRAVPPEDWLNVSSRTIFDFNEAYGKLTEPGQPAIKTSLYHLDAEQDWYASTRIFVFGQAAFDHSFSQGLQLQQNYSGGLGVIMVKTANQELDFKASVDYIEQQFEGPTSSRELVGSTFGETYLRKFTHGIGLNEQAGVTPSWNDSSAYSAFASAALTLPVHHRFGLTLGALDNFLNDPPPGFRKNSFQFTLGATYSLQ